MADAPETSHEVFNAVAGYGAIQKYLDDQSVEEIWINEPSRVFVARNGRSELTTTVLTADEVRDLVERMLKSTGRPARRDPGLGDVVAPGCPLAVAGSTGLRARMRCSTPAPGPSTEAAEPGLARGVRAGASPGCGTSSTGRGTPRGRRGLGPWAAAAAGALSPPTRLARAPRSSCPRRGRILPGADLPETPAAGGDRVHGATADGTLVSGRANEDLAGEVAAYAVS